MNRRCQKVSIVLLQPQFCVALLQEPSGLGVLNIPTLAGRGLSKGMIAVEHELQPAADWVFQTGCFAPGSTALFSTIGALRAPVFYRLWR